MNVGSLIMVVYVGYAIAMAKLFEIMGRDAFYGYWLGGASGGICLAVSLMLRSHWWIGPILGLFTMLMAAIILFATPTKGRSRVV